MTTKKISSRWKLAVLLPLLLLIPGVSLAAEPTSPRPERLSGTEAPASLHLLEDEPRDEPTPDINPVWRLASEIGAEAVISLMMGIPGALGGGLLCGVLEPDETSSFRCWTSIGYGFLAGVTLGAPLGVWSGGKLARGQGTLSGAFIGTGAAAVLGAVVTLFVYNDDIQPFVIPTFSLIGALIGYEVSHHMRLSARSPPATSIQPVIGFSAHGGTLGMAGRF